MNDLPRGPLQPLPAPDGAFDKVTRRARARRNRTAGLVSGLGLALAAVGVVAALPSPEKPSQDRVITKDPTPTATPTVEPTRPPSPSPSPSPSPTASSLSPVDPDEAAARSFVDAWRQGDTAGMRQVADEEQVEVAMSFGRAQGQPNCTTNQNGQYQCVVAASSGKRVYFLIGQPGGGPGYVWWVAQYVPGT